MNEIRAAQEELNRAFSEAGQSFYAQNQSAGPSGEAGPTGPTAGQPGSTGTGQAPNEDVVEADYEIVDENKK
jgi:molecular chaperone DnaK